MLNILSILKHVFNGVTTGDPRYTVINDEHILDSKTGVKLHLYDDWFKITHDGKVIIRMPDFTQEEKEIIWGIKQFITNPITLKQREADYPNLLKARRTALSNLFENPTPIVDKSPIAEENTTEYTG